MKSSECIAAQLEKFPDIHLDQLDRLLNSKDPTSEPPILKFSFQPFGSPLVALTYRRAIA